MKAIKYVGPFYRVNAEGFSFTRHLPVEVPEAVAEKLLSAHLNGQTCFVSAVEVKAVAVKAK